MDQLTILKQIEKLIEQIERTIDSRYAQLQRKLIREVERMYDEYSQNGSLPIAQVYAFNRAQAFLRRLDNVALKEYKLMTKALVQMQETVFTTTFLSLVYLVEQFFKDYGRIDKLKRGQMNDAIKQALIQTFADLCNRYKNDLVYQVNNDFLQHVRGEGNFTDAKKKVKKRVQSSRDFIKQRVGEMLESVANAARDLLYHLTKDAFGTEKFWLSKRDMKVRKSHRILDGQKADRQGYFHLNGMKAKYPRLWVDMSENYGCRCIVFFTFNGKMPIVMRGRDYRDDTYQKRLANRIDELMPNMTYKQAIEQAMKDIEPPEREMPFMPHDEWLKEYGEIN